jgi:hypothetical protein
MAPAAIHFEEEVGWEPEGERARRRRRRQTVSREVRRRGEEDG